MAKAPTTAEPRPKATDVLTSIADQALAFRYAGSNRMPTLVDIGRVVIAASRVLHIKDLDERISVENACVLAIAKKRELIN